MTRPAKPPRARKDSCKGPLTNGLGVPGRHDGGVVPSTGQKTGHLICTAGDSCAAWDEGSSPRCVETCQAGNLWLARPKRAP
jgi:hypothetical protein